MLIITLFAFAFGAIFGSFLNVLIFRIPKGEEFVKTKSHCMTCGYNLKWYDLIPIISWLSLKGKCRSCKAPISPQYPLVETACGLLWAVAFVVLGVQPLTLISQALFSALLALSVIDFRTYEIPVGFNVFIGILGIIATVVDISNWYVHLIGAVCVSLPLLIIFYLSQGRAIGGGDIKLMAAAGLVLGWPATVLALFIGCVLGAVIHTIRMRVSGEGKMLAMGPYLSAGIVIALLWGEKFINWYMRLLL